MEQKEKPMRWPSDFPGKHDEQEKAGTGIKERAEIFNRHLKGITAHRTAQVFSCLNPAIDYRGCSKSHMLKAWAVGSDLDTKYGGFTHLTEDDLIRAKEQASAWW
ncbi:MAG: hypothetical protein ACTJHY_12675 [Alcaligenes pakistanensis]